MSIRKNEANSTDKYYNAIEEYIDKYHDQFELNEGLMTSYPIEKTVAALKKYCSRVGVGGERVYCFFKGDTRKTNVGKEFFRTMNLCGWFVVNAGIDQPSNIYKEEDLLKSYFSEKGSREVLTITLSPKYDTESKIPDTLWHVTPTEYVDKILRIGLMPKTQYKIAYHPERIYMCTSKNQAIGLAKKLAVFSESREYSLLEIDTRKIPSYFKIYSDPEFMPYGRYTVNNIPPNAITKVKDFPVKTWNS